MGAQTAAPAAGRLVERIAPYLGVKRAPTPLAPTSLAPTPLADLKVAAIAAPAGAEQ